MHDRPHGPADRRPGAVLAHLDDGEEDAFTVLVGELPVRCVSREGPDVLPAVRDRLPAGERDRPGQLVLALDGEPVARTAPHGGELRWLPRAEPDCVRRPRPGRCAA